MKAILAVLLLLLTAAGIYHSVVLADEGLLELTEQSEHATSGYIRKMSP